jgi:putative membrane protein
MMQGWYHSGMAWGWVSAGIMVVAMAVLVTGLVVGAVVLLRQVTRPNRSETEALQILQARFAHGEIDDDEYRRMRGKILHTTVQ